MWLEESQNSLAPNRRVWLCVVCVVWDSVGLLTAVEPDSGMMRGQMGVEDDE